MELLTKVAFVAAGGAVGAVARYLVNISPVSAVCAHFPLPTFLINLTGSFLLGFFLILLTDRVAVSEGVRLGVLVGFVGAFTTFSTFEAEIYGLLRERHFAATALYLLMSVVLGFIGLLGGIWLARKI